MNRWIWFGGCAVLGLLLLGAGLRVPAHLRAVETGVLQRAGRQGPTLLEQGMRLVKGQQLGAAWMLSEAAQAVGLSGREQLSFAVANLAKQNPHLRFLGSAEPSLDGLIAAPAEGSNALSQPFTEVVIRLANRERVLNQLHASAQRGVQEVLRFRAATNTVIFPPSQSSSGQALDAALSICGLLLENAQMTTGLSNTVCALASQASHGGNSQPFEEVLMDLMSLGQRFNWGQLAAFVRPIENAETLRRLAHLVRRADSQLPLLFAAVELSGRPEAVAGYLMKFSRTGLKDLGASLQFGAGGVNELLQRNLRLYQSGPGPHLAVGYSLRQPRLALILKWLLYLAGGFLLAAGLHFARPSVTALERPLQVRGFHVAREILFALGFLLVVVLLSEPFLAQEGQKGVLPFQLRLPMAGGTVPAGNPGVNSSFMNQTNNLLTMMLFFVLQGLLYTACIVKLAEIRRQRVAPRMKLKLLENEEHLFDAGLYLGFLGTIVSFIVYSLFAHHEFSLMVAYSSTSFGILFVSFFKIFHLRPVRRRLLLEAEVESSDALMSGGTPTLASS